MFNLNRIKTTFKSKVARNLTLVSAGNLIAAGIGFLAILIISRHTSVAGFGMFSISMSIIFVSSILTPLGTDIGMLKFASSSLGKAKVCEADEIIRATFFFRVLASAICALVVFLSAPLVASHPKLISLIRVSAAGIFIISMFNYVKSVLYAYGLYARYVAAQISTDIIKVVGAVIIMAFFDMDAFYGVCIFALSPCIGFIIGFWKINPAIFVGKKNTKKVLRKLFNFSKWIFVSTVCRMAFPYAGTFILAKISGVKAAGIYGLALNLTYIFPILINSMNSVLLPEAARFKNISQFERYIKASFKAFAALLLLAIPVILFSKNIIPFIFGAKYSESIPAFNFLILGYTILAITSIIRQALYSIDRPKEVAIAEIFRVVLMIAGCYVLIPSLGVIAPAILVLGLNIAFMVYLLAVISRQIRGYKAGTVEIESLEEEIINQA